MDGPRMRLLTLRDKQCLTDEPAVFKMDLTIKFDDGWDIRRSYPSHSCSDAAVHCRPSAGALEPPPRTVTAAAVVSSGAPGPLLSLPTSETEATT